MIRLIPRAAPFLLLGVCALLVGTPARAHAAEVVILVADRLERADLWDHPGRNLARLRREGAGGLMCVRFLLSSLPESAYVALGAGSYVQYEGSARWRGGGTPADAAAFAVDAGRALPPGALYCRESERLRLYSNQDSYPGHWVPRCTPPAGARRVSGMPTCRACRAARSSLCSWMSTGSWMLGTSARIPRPPTRRRREE